MDARSERPPGVREIDHSGDVGLEIDAATRRELLEKATLGLCGLMTWSRVEPVSRRAIEVRATSFADLVVDWLSAVILSAATHAELYARADIETAEDGFASGLLHAAPLDVERHELRFDVKAATYHGLVVEETPGGFHARIIFDL